MATQRRIDGKGRLDPEVIKNGQAFAKKEIGKLTAMIHDLNLPITRAFRERAKE